MTTVEASSRRPPSALGALPVVFTRADALAAGLSRHGVQALSRSPAWHRLAPGVFCSAPAWRAAGPDGRARLTAVAVALRWPATAVSHLSAAALHGLPLPLLRGASPHPTWLTAPPASGVSPRRRPGLVIEVASLPPRHLAAQDARWSRRPVLVTSRARTVADCLRHLPADDAVAVADAAGASGASRADVHEVLGEQARWPLAASARALLPLVDPRRESWLESASAVAFARSGLPPPEPQVEVWTLEGRFIARVDGLWWEHGTVGEADGWGKYGSGAALTVARAERALRAEKQREDALRDTGLEVVRWGTRGIVHPSALAETVARVRRAFARGDRGRVRAHLRPSPLPAGW